MKFNFTIDLRAWFQVGWVGSAIYGKLLSPNDVDIAICFKVPLFYKPRAKCFRVGKYNFIVCYGVTVEEYVNEFDMNILKAYRTFWKKTFITSYSSSIKYWLKHKSIVQQPRESALFKGYNDSGETESNNRHDRAEKYIKKLPRGWTFYPLSYYKPNASGDDRQIEYVKRSKKGTLRWSYYKPNTKQRKSR